MRCIDKQAVINLSEELGCTRNLAQDLLTLAGEDADLVKSASDQSRRLGQLKAEIIDERFSQLEEDVASLYKLLELYGIQ